MEITMGDSPAPSRTPVPYSWLLVLVLLGLIATDFVVTRSLSAADAATHLIHNPLWKQDVEWLGHNKDALRGWLPSLLRGRFFDFWNEQLVITVLLSILGFAFWALL